MEARELCFMAGCPTEVFYGLGVGFTRNGSVAAQLRGSKITGSER